MRMFFLGWAFTAAAAGCWAQNVQIFLNDGRRLEATLLEEGDRFVLIQTGTLRAQLPRSQIAAVCPAPAEATGQAGGTATVFGSFHSNQPPSTFEKQLIESQQPPAPVESRFLPHLPLPENPQAREALWETVERLRGGRDPGVRLAAQQALAQAGDVGLAALIEYGLYNPTPSIRTDAVQLLAQLGGRRVLKYLIEAYWSAAYPTIPPYQRDYITALGRAIMRLSGQPITLYLRGSTTAPQVAANLVKWWKDHLDEVPRQVGEPEIPPTAPNYVADIEQVRSLDLQKREFGGSNLPPSVALPPEPNTPAEQGFLTTFPVIPRGRPFFEGIVPTNPETILQQPVGSENAPGELRTKEYIERVWE